MNRLSFVENTFVEKLVQTADASQRGTIWDVTIIKAGQSKNLVKQDGKHGSLVYSKEVISSAIPKFEGAKVYANRTAPHVEANQKSVRDEVGWLQEVRMEGDEMRGKLYLVPSAEWLRNDLLFALDKNKKDFKELSIHAGGNVNARQNGNGWLFDVSSIDVVESVDVVPKGAAGGKFNHLLESHNNNEGKIMNGLKLKLLSLFSLLYPTFLESKNVDWLMVNENELFTHLMEADKANPRMNLPDGSQLDEKVIDSKIAEMKEGFINSLDKVLAKLTEMKETQKPDKVDMVDLKEAQNQIKAQAKQLAELQEANCQTMLGVKLKESNLPMPLQESIAKRYKGKIFTEAEISSQISSEKELYGKLMPNNPRSVFAEAGIDRLDKIQLGLDGFFLTSGQGLKPVRAGTEEAKTLLKGVTPFRSIREAYIQITGDEQVTGMLDRKTKFTESIDTTQFAQVVADALNKRLVRDYSALNLESWRAFADVIPLSDFKTQHRVRFGGYANLPTVAQGAAYTALTSPTDEEVTYAATKRGGTEEITREAIMNDDIGAIQRIPTRMARAAAQTLHEFVYEFINPATNPTYEPDSVVLYHTASHANLGSVALDATGLSAARLRMKKQTQAGSSKRIGLRARYLIVPPDLEKSAYDLLTPAFAQNNQTPDFLQQIGITPIVVDYWTDTNNWVLVADRADVVGLEIGFVNGQETPELFVSDLNNVGSWFTNDKITYKIRHEYGGDLLDYRGFDGSIVA